jgi:hypothetical protein
VWCSIMISGESGFDLRMPCGCTLPVLSPISVLQVTRGVKRLGRVLGKDSCVDYLLLGFVVCVQLLIRLLCKDLSLSTIFWER